MKIALRRILPLTVATILLAVPAAAHAVVGGGTNGQLVFTVFDYSGTADIKAANSDGSGLRNLTNTPGVGEASPSVSPDGTTLAFHSWDAATWQQTDVFTMPIAGGTRTPVTTRAGRDDYPTYCGSQLAYLSAFPAQLEDNTYDQTDVMLGGANVSNTSTYDGAHQIGDYNEGPPECSPAGQVITHRMTDTQCPLTLCTAMAAGPKTSNNQLWLLPATQFTSYYAGGNLQMAQGYLATFSPDGGRIAFAGMKVYGSPYNVYLYTSGVDGSNPIQVTSLGAFKVPQSMSWSPDGTQVALTIDGTIKIVTMATGAITTLYGLGDVRDVEWTRVQSGPTGTTPAGDGGTTPAGDGGTTSPDGSTPPPGGGGSSTVKPTTPPKPVLPTLPPLPSQAFIQSGFNYQITMDQSGTISATITIPTASGNLLRAKPKKPTTLVIGSAKASVKKPGKVKVKLLLNQVGKARLRKLGTKGKPKKVTATATFTVTNAAGQKTTLVRALVINA